jgi:MoaA/NifB/PqqE/SkfB family radical SAM enzyme
MAIAHHLKNLSYLLSRRPYRLEKPVVLQFPVIDICNSQCQMCRIWENKKSDDLTPEQLRHGLRNPLYSEVASVGLNGGEPTLRKDLGDLAAVLFEELPRLRSVSLITNAYKHDEVIARITDVGEVVRRHGGRLDVMVSLDGFGDVHDRVRGKPGNFERAQQVIRFAKQSPLVHNLRIGCTIIKENVYGLADLFEYCQSEGLYVKYRLGIPPASLHTGPDRPLLFECRGQVSRRRVSGGPDRPLRNQPAAEALLPLPDRPDHPPGPAQGWLRLAAPRRHHHVQRRTAVLRGAEQNPGQDHRTRQRAALLR